MPSDDVRVPTTPGPPRSPEFAAAMRRAENRALGNPTDERSREEIMASIEEAVNEESLRNARRGLGLN